MPRLGMHNAHRRSLVVSVRLGLEQLQRDGFSLLRGKHIGLLVNVASLDSCFTSAVEIFRSAKDIELVALFGPQHGIWAETQDNMVEWEGYRDLRTGIMVYSLYGKTRIPLPEMLRGIEALVIDLPDVGARYYTFAWTMILCLQACARQEIPCVVLDRPNPLNGATVEGPLLDPSFASFVGLYPLPIRHGLTIGELATYCTHEFDLHARLTVVPLEGWQRSMWYDQTGLPWVMPSPNMPTLDTALVYPGMALLEGTNISEGRGTTRPFEIFGMPGIDPYELVDALAKEDLPGVKFRPLSFIPTFQKHQGKTCGGAHLHVTDRSVFLPVLTAVAVIKNISQRYPEIFAWKHPPYEYEEEKFPFDILAGTDQLRLHLEAGTSLKEIARSWDEGKEAFLRKRAPYLLY